jgi:hypothetical protein
MPDPMPKDELGAAESRTVPAPFILGDQNESVETRAWLGLLWSEWHAHSKLVLLFIGLWLGAVWMLPQFAHIEWLLFFGAIFALIAGPIIAGNDVLEGCEEYCFSLPITRYERYLCRVLAGVGLVLIFTLLDVLALGLDMHQAINLLLINTGLVQPMQSIQPRFLYGLVLAFPLAVFCFGFSVAANARNRAFVLMACFWAVLGALVVLRIGLLCEFSHWGIWNGYVACPGLVIVSLAALVIGSKAFQKKEVVQATKPWIIPTYWWFWIFLAIGGVLLCIYLLGSLFREFGLIFGK